MKKILVTTDFSPASRAGMRFAIQLATQMEAELVFFHSFQALIPTTVLQERIDNELNVQGKEALRQLERFVVGIHRAMKIHPGKQHSVVVENLNPERAIIDYAKEHEFDFICISTRGAGGLRKLLGTHTTSVLHRSTVPVLVVPSTYRVRPIKKILYASDVVDLQQEIAVVSAFAEEIQAKTDLTHFYFSGESPLDPPTLKQMWQLQYPQLDKIYLEHFNHDSGFPAQLEKLCSRTKPSIVVFFAHTNKTWFDKLFSTSISETVSFATKTPLLIWRKSA
jgi:nucleotide-binding universal stress UspA family protein